MTLKNLVTAGLVGENEKIVLYRALGIDSVYDVRQGSWHDDCILDYFNYEIEFFKWSFKDGLRVMIR